MYESHITIEPVFDEKLMQARAHAMQFRFKVASLLMKKRQTDQPERSEHDTFMTGHDTDFDSLQTRMSELVQVLQTRGFKVWRYKIEHILLDSRTEDVLNLL